MSSRFSITAIMAAFNEADIIRPVVAALVEEGIGVYLLDDGSTDGTAAVVGDLVGHGIIAIEQLSRPACAPEAPDRSFSLRRILTRKEELVRQLDATWFINQDADEFRESPWWGTSFAEGVRLVDALGYNAIDFHVVDFVPTHDHLQPGEDPRPALPCCEASSPLNRLQIRCFKKLPGPLDLVSSGGHEAAFPGRQVFPIRFLLRHYPFRTQAQAERKLFIERRPRYAAAERAAGWHVQYDALSPGHAFVRSVEGLARFDPQETRVHLHVHNRVFEAALDHANARCAELGEALASADASVRRQEADIQRLEGELEHGTAARTAVERELVAIRASMSWRVTRPLRWAWRWLGPRSPQ